MSKKENNTKHQDTEDIAIDYDEEIQEEFQLKDKNKKLRSELSDCKKQSQEYLVGWQKERADFANYKANEEKKRTERIASLRTGLITDFFPVLDSFDMAFSNKEAWEKVDSNWRMGVEYIYSQLMSVLENYHVEVINTDHIHFDPMFHDPVETVDLDSPELDGKIIRIIQKGYRVSDSVLRPAKVQVGYYATLPGETTL